MNMDQIMAQLNIPQEGHPEKEYVMSKFKTLYVEDGLVVLSEDNLDVLDVGCGRHKTYPSFIGMDIDPVADIYASADKLPREDHSVHAIVSRHSIEHLIDTVALLREWHRVLRTGGAVIFVLPDHEFINTMQHVLAHEQHLHAFTRATFSNLVNNILKENELQSLFTIREIETVVPDWSFGGVLIAN